MIFYQQMIANEKFFKKSSWENVLHQGLNNSLKWDSREHRWLLRLKIDLDFLAYIDNYSNRYSLEWIDVHLYVKLHLKKNYYIRELFQSIVLYSLFDL